MLVVRVQCSAILIFPFDLLVYRLNEEKLILFYNQTMLKYTLLSICTYINTLFHNKYVHIFDKPHEVYWKFRKKQSV